MVGKKLTEVFSRYGKHLEVCVNFPLRPSKMNNILDSFVDIKSVFIVGRRWFERTNGNTYHSAEIYINNKMVHKIDFCYGYGSQYEYTAFAWLKKNGYINYEGNPSPWRFFEEKEISYNHSVTDVKRKKDL